MLTALLSNVLESPLYNEMLLGCSMVVLILLSAMGDMFLYCIYDVFGLSAVFSDLKDGWFFKEEMLGNTTFLAQSAVECLLNSRGEMNVLLGRLFRPLEVAKML